MNAEGILVIIKGLYKYIRPGLLKVVTDTANPIDDWVVKILDYLLGYTGE